jgi:hypothetical protein
MTILRVLTENQMMRESFSHAILDKRTVTEIFVDCQENPRAQ